MVSDKEYFYYLKNAFKNNNVRGYSIGKKSNGKTCIFFENGSWIVSRVHQGTAINPKEYDPEDLWHACEDIIARLAADEDHRKAIWMDWASPTDWAEKMDDPLVAYKIPSSEEIKQENKRIIEDGKVRRGSL